jgi:hypothetical protein
MLDLRVYEDYYLFGYNTVQHVEVQRFGGKYCIHLQGRKSKKPARSIRQAKSSLTIILLIVTDLRTSNRTNSLNFKFLTCLFWLFHSEFSIICKCYIPSFQIESAGSLFSDLHKMKYFQNYFLNCSNYTSCRLKILLLGAVNSMVISRISSILINR